MACSEDNYTKLCYSKQSLGTTDLSTFGKSLRSNKRQAENLGNRNVCNTVGHSSGRQGSPSLRVCRLEGSSTVGWFVR